MEKKIKTDKWNKQYKVNLPLHTWDHIWDILAERMKLTNGKVPNETELLGDYFEIGLFMHMLNSAYDKKNKKKGVKTNAKVDKPA